jgi:hypothetical protein
VLLTVALATLSYAVAAVVPGLLLSLAALSQREGRPDMAGDFLVAAYLLTVSASLSTAGFLAGTAWSARWRQSPRRRAVIIAGTLGLISPVVSLFVAAALTPVLLPLLRSGYSLGAVPFYASGGVVLGVVAIAIAYVKRAGSEDPAPFFPKP